MDIKAYFNDKNDLCIEVTEGYNKQTWILNSAGAVKLADLIYDRYMPKEEFDVDNAEEETPKKPKKKKYSIKKLDKLVDYYLDKYEDVSIKLHDSDILWDFLDWLKKEEENE